MSTDPYLPPETDVRVADSLPPRPALGIALAFLFSFICGIALSSIFSFVIMNLLNPDSATPGGSADPIDQLRLVTNLYFAQMFLGLIIAFIAGFICVRLSRSSRWLYLFILIALSATPTLLMMLTYDESRTPLIAGGMALQFAAILIGGRVAMIGLRNKQRLSNASG